MARSRRLFEHDLPPGLHYRDDFITESEEGELLDAIAGISFSNFEMRGVVARRRVAFFGQSYDRTTAGPLTDREVYPSSARMPSTTARSSRNCSYSDPKRTASGSSAICISKTLNHLDGRICAPQTFAQVGCEILSRVTRLVALAAR